MVLTRGEVAQEDQWNLERFFPSLAAWEKEAQSVLDRQSAKWQALVSYRGKLGQSAAELKEFFDLFHAYWRQVDKLYTYAHLGHDQDTTNEEYKCAHQKVQLAAAMFAEDMAWVEPELLALPKETYQALCQDSQLQEYQFFLEKLASLRAHVLTAEQERILSLVSSPLRTASSAFSALNNSDFDFGKVVDGKGSEQELSHANYQLYLHGQDRVLRENAFKGIAGAYLSHENTICELLQGCIRGHWSEAQARNYSSCLESSLTPKNVPEEVYTSLVAACREGIASHHRYNELRKSLLGYDKLYPYDLYVPLRQEGVLDGYGFDEACQLVVESAAPLGEEYQQQLLKGLTEERWVDRYENKGKRSGAYSSGCYDSSPYILMNFKGLLNDVFTLTHEAGHSMHSLYSRKSQPYHYSQYSIFVAEVASTFHEELLMQHLLEKTEDPAQRFFLINQKLDDIRATLFRQTMFAEFELMLHQSVERGEPLTPASLKQKYQHLVQEYMGPAVTCDERISIEWARIPHFYYNFYVFQYATGISAALCLADRVLNGGEQERRDYLRFLTKGGSQYPIDQLKEAGVDMRSKEPVLSALKRFDKYLDELEALHAPA